MIKRVNMSPGPADFSHLVDVTNEGQLFPHWSKSCKAVYQDLSNKLRTVLGTTSPVLLMMTSGTGAIEALLTNALSVGDKVLVISNGFFGDRLHRMALWLGLEPRKLEFDWECPVDTAEVRRLISDRGRDARAVLMVHLETSTGILNQLAPVGAFLHDKDTLFMVDAVSSVGTCAISMEEWKVDGLASVSYKGLRSPPGLSMIALSDKYLLSMRDTQTCSYSLSLRKALKRSNLLMTMSTAPVDSMILLQRQLARLLSGLDDHYARCRTQATALRSALRGVGLKVFGTNGLGNCITATWVPQGLRRLDLPEVLETEFGLFVGAGLGKLQGATIRFAHYGNLSAPAIEFVCSCISSTLRKYMQR